MSQIIKKNDWRLQGQEKYLQGKTLKWKNYKTPRSDWDHDHCEFCGIKFMEQTSSKILDEGYTTADEYHWICKKCFVDFKEMFEWKVV